MPITKSFVCSLLLLSLLPWSANGQSDNPNVKITLTNGSVISVVLQDSKFTWADIDESGPSEKREIAIADIKEVVLSLIHI